MATLRVTTRRRLGNSVEATARAEFRTSGIRPVTAIKRNATPTASFARLYAGILYRFDMDAGAGLIAPASLVHAVGHFDPYNHYRVEVTALGDGGLRHLTRRR